MGSPVLKPSKESWKLNFNKPKTTAAGIIAKNKKNIQINPIIHQGSKFLLLKIRGKSITGFWSFVSFSFMFAGLVTLKYLKIPGKKRIQG